MQPEPHDVNRQNRPRPGEATLKTLTDALTVANTRTMMGNRTVAERDTKSMAEGARAPSASPGKENREEVQGSPGG